MLVAVITALKPCEDAAVVIDPKSDSTCLKRLDNALCGLHQSCAKCCWIDQEGSVHAPRLFFWAISKWLFCSFTLELDAIKWHLCQDRTPFVDASIVGVMLDSIQNKDLSGTTPLTGAIFSWTCFASGETTWLSRVTWDHQSALLFAAS